jgi:hypothetical protein
MGNARGEGLGLAALAVVSLPTGREEDYLGDGSATVEPRLALDLSFARRLRVGTNIGYLVRENEPEVFGLTVGDEVTYGAAIELPVIGEDTTLLAEADGAVGVVDGQGTEEAPLEIRGALRMYDDESGLAGVRWTPPLGGGSACPEGDTDGCPEADNDGDGFKDSKDECPNAAGFGESRPLLPIVDEKGKALKKKALKAARAKNRRVMFMITERSDTE